MDLGKKMSDEIFPSEEKSWLKGIGVILIHSLFYFASGVCENVPQARSRTEFLDIRKISKRL